MPEAVTVVVEETHPLPEVSIHTVHPTPEVRPVFLAVVLPGLSCFI